MVRYSFPGKIVLVTGSSRGMGAAILQAFATAGAACVVNYFNDPDGQNRRDAEQTAEELRKLNVPVHLFDADVRDYDSVERMMKRVAETVGGLDILVNNAGICRDRTVKKMSLDEWHSVLETNLDGVFYCSKLGAEILRDGGRIVNIASISGVVGFLAKELARRQITVNALAPGVIQTPMLGVIKPEVLAEYEKAIPVGRIGRPEDVAHAVLFFACAESSYITGQTLAITGGWF